MENPIKTRQYTLNLWLKWLIPILLATFVTIAAFFDDWIEEVYSQQVYPSIGAFQRVITSWLPFSLGDLIYLASGIWLVIKVITTIRDLLKKKVTRQKTLQRGYRVLRWALWLYIIFSFIWGWNYHRKGIEYQLGLPIGPYESGEVKQVLEEVILRLNEHRLLVSKDTVLPTRSFDDLAREATACFTEAAKAYPFLEYSHPSIKKSIYSSVAQYGGFTGYYNPFTGEAQLRTHLPAIMKPFVICHEIGHQVGYAKENEASFVGYLAAFSSSDSYAKYSVYLELYAAVRNRLLLTSFLEGDTTVFAALPGYNKKLDTLVRYDRRKIHEYFRLNENYLSTNMSSVIMSMYGQYLKANKQNSGLKSYDDVVSLLIAFRRKYGKI